MSKTSCLTSQCVSFKSRILGREKCFLSTGFVEHSGGVTEMIFQEGLWVATEGIKKHTREWVSPVRYLSWWGRIVNSFAASMNRVLGGCSLEAWERQCSYLHAGNLWRTGKKLNTIWVNIISPVQWPHFSEFRVYSNASFPFSVHKQVWTSPE